MRRSRWSTLVVVATIALTLQVSPAHAQDGEELPECGVEFADYSREGVATGERLLDNVPIEMSDGVTLYADVTVPTGVDGPFPTTLTITGYNKDLVGAAAESIPIASGPNFLVEYGYAVVVVDDRGTGSSGGMWDSWGERTRADYPEILDWIVSQDWSNGHIGVTGGSYMGITSLFTAASGHDAVDAVFATVPMGDAYRDIVLQGGQVNTAFIPLWMGLVTVLGAVPIGSDPSVLVDHILGITRFQLPTIADSVLGGPTAFDSEFWRQRSPLEVTEDIDVPTFIVGGNDDIFQRGEPLLYEGLADHTDARLLMGPWTHGTVGQGLPEQIPSLSALTLQWFDEHVAGLDAGAECIPPVTQYYAGAGEYRTAPTWPVPDLEAQRWFLRGDDSLTRAEPGAEGSDTYLQLPINGLCTRSMNQWLIGLAVAIPGCGTDNTLDEMTALTWTTEPFAEPMAVNGPIQADLWLRTALGSEALTSVAVSIVGPDGVSRGVTNGQLTLSHRAVDESRSRLLDGQSIQPWHPFTRAAARPVPTGEPVLAQVEVFPTSMEIPAGSRLRVTVAAYDVPHALPPLPAAVSTLAGPVDVLHNAEYPSSIVLPVVAASSQNPADAVVADVAEVASGGEMAPGAPDAPDAPPSNAPTLPATGGETPVVAFVALVLVTVSFALRWCRTGSITAR